MSTITEAPPAVPAPRGGRHKTDADVEMAARGTTTVPEKVVARIAAQAASEVDGTRALTGRLGGLIGNDSGGGAGAARAHVRLSGTHVTLRLVIAVRYPSPLRGTAREVRAHVRKRIEEYTGLAVQHIDIEIGELVPARRTR